MLKTNSIFFTFVTSFGLMATPAFAQTVGDIETLNTAETPKKRVVRVVEAIPMWVDAEKLRIRDNPYAGDVIGMLAAKARVACRPVA